MRRWNGASVPFRPPPAAAERRMSARYPCSLSISCQPTAAAGKVLAARSLDVSFEGLGLVLPQPLEPGTLVEVEMRNAAGNFARIRLLLVVHTRPNPEGGWLLGGTFYTELTSEELHALHC
jgi:hypothetical protein